MSNSKAVGVIAAAVFVLAGSFYAGYSARNGSPFAADLLQITNPAIPVIQSSMPSSTATSSGIGQATVPSISAVQATTTTIDFKRTDYQIFENVDLCKMKRMSDQGWQISQMGAVLDFPGLDSDCRTRSNSGIDWVVFSRDRDYNVIAVPADTTPGQ